MSTHRFQGRLSAIVGSGTRWLPLASLCGLTPVFKTIGACVGDNSSATIGDPPIQGLERLVESSDLAVIGRVEAISEIQVTPVRDESTVQLAYYEASVEVELILFGLDYERVAVQLPAYRIASDRRTSIDTPTLEQGEPFLLFLTQDDPFLDLRGDRFVIDRAEDLWGKLTIADERIATINPVREWRPTEEVTEWVETARYSLAKPGALSGEVSGLNEADHATLTLLEYDPATVRLLRLGGVQQLENGEIVDQWTVGNGPWKRVGLRLSQGTYILIPEAEGYVPRVFGLVFRLPPEGMEWRERLFPAFEFFSPEYVDSKNIGSGTGYKPELIIRGRIFGITDEMNASVQIQRLPKVPNETYVTVPSARQDSQTYFPPELTCLNEIDGLAPDETVAVVEVHSGRWGLSDHSLWSNRYLITVEAHGQDISPRGYIAALFGGRTPNRLRGVDFHIGGSDTAFCDSDSGTMKVTSLHSNPTPETFRKVPTGLVFADTP